MEDSREKVKQNLEEEKTFNGIECLSISAVCDMLCTSRFEIMSVTDLR